MSALRLSGCLQILVWDLRGGSGGGVSFGGSGPTRHPLVQATDVLRACRNMSYTAATSSDTLQSLTLDPANDHRCAFQLSSQVAGRRNGWHLAQLPCGGHQSSGDTSVCHHCLLELPTSRPAVLRICLQRVTCTVLALLLCMRRRQHG